jgi:hypothetical protein
VIEMDDLCEIATYMTMKEFKKLKKEYKNIELVNDEVKARCYVVINIPMNLPTILKKLERE